MVVADGLALQLAMGHQYQGGAVVSLLHYSLASASFHKAQSGVSHHFHEVAPAHPLKQGKLRQLVVYSHISEK